MSVFERERAYVCMSGGGTEREREHARQRIPSRLCADSAEPDVGLELTNP